MKNIESVIEEMYVDLCKSLHIKLELEDGYNSIKYFGPQLKNRKFLINEIVGGYYFLSFFEFFKEISYDPHREINIIYSENESAIMFKRERKYASYKSNFEYWKNELTLFCMIESVLPKGTNYNSEFKKRGFAIVSSAFISGDERIVYDSFALTITLNEDHLEDSGHTIEDVCKDWKWLNYISQVFKECVENYMRNFEQEEKIIKIKTEKWG